MLAKIVLKLPTGEGVPEGVALAWSGKSGKIIILLLLF